MEHKLVMRFTTDEDGKYFSIDVPRIKVGESGQPEVTEEQVKTLMDVIIEKNIFKSNSGRLVGKKDAKIVSTDTTEFELQ